MANSTALCCLSAPYGPNSNEASLSLLSACAIRVKALFFLSITALVFLSSLAFALASSIIEFISCSFKLEPPEIVTVCFLPVVLSVALTSKRPLASISVSYTHLTLPTSHFV